VIGGHQRLFVLRDLGYSEADVAVVDLSKADEKALNIALNKISGEWDEEKLAAIFAELDADGYDMRLTGFAEDEITVALVDAIDGDLEITGEVPFSEVLREEHNYIVLYFDNEVDWLQAESLFALETVKALSTRTDGKMTPGQERKGVGRVIRGAEALEAIRCAYQCELPQL
jgi:ParB-like chromosome segregation protein Spo0J